MFDAPFPIDSRRGDDGRIRFADFPNPFDNLLMSQFAETVDRAPYGYARNGAVFFAFDGPIDATRIPEVDDTTALDSPILVIDVDAGSDARATLLPFVARYRDVEATYHPRHFLTVLPYPGIVLAPERTYAVVVRRGLGGPDQPLAPAPAVSALLAQPDATPLGDGFAALGSTLDALGVDHDDVAVATVFTTGPESSEVRALHADAAARASPLEITGRIRDTAAYCALEGETTVPIYQAGERPYLEPFSGGIEFDDAGRPEVQWEERIRFSLAVPRTPPPAGGHPVLLYAPGGAGIYTQSLDRGTFADQAADPENGRGPAHLLAQAGIATLSFEAALTGPRHPTGSLANLDFFNFRNLVAFRDNIRQAAAELSLMAQAVRDVRVPEGVLCDGIDALRLDPERIHLYGHSTGSTVGAVAAGVDPVFDAVMFSGAGGDWIYNLALKQEPVFIAPLVEGLLRMKPDERLDAFHPVATLFQMALEPVSHTSWAAEWRPRHRLLIGGQVDGYQLPRMISALAMAGDLDLAGPAHDDRTVADLALVGRGAVPLPAPPAEGRASAYLVKFVADGFDGHYVPFELDAAKRTWKCWWAAVARGDAPTVALDGGDPDAPCR